MQHNCMMQNKIAMVTGASHRVGREIALALARAGANVVVHHFNYSAEAAQTAAEIRAMGREAWVVVARFADLRGGVFGVELQLLVVMIAAGKIGPIGCA